MVAPRSHVGYSTNPLYFWCLDSFFGNGWIEWTILTQTRNVRSVTKIWPTEYLSVWLILGNRRSSEGLRSFKPQIELIWSLFSSWLGISKWTQVPGFNPAFAKKYCKASDKVVECEDCEKRFHASCAKLLKLESGNGSWYCTNCKANCGLCSGAVLKDHKAVQCDICEMWVHNGCSLITESQCETLQGTNCTWICPKCEFFNFSDSFFFFFFFFGWSVKLRKSN